jgi:hypothetical protein
MQNGRDTVEATMTMIFELEGWGGEIKDGPVPK